MSKEIRKEIQSELSTFKENLDNLRSVNKTITDAGDVAVTAYDLLEKKSKLIEELSGNAQKQFSDINSTLEILRELSASFKSVHSDFESMKLPQTLEELNKETRQFISESKDYHESSNRNFQQIQSQQEKIVTQVKSHHEEIKSLSTHVEERFAEVKTGIGKNEHKLGQVQSALNALNKSIEEKKDEILKSLNVKTGRIETRLRESIEVSEKHAKITYVVLGMIILIQVAFYFI